MLYWKRMPSLWIARSLPSFLCVDTSTAIAALKIYISFCLFSKNGSSGRAEASLTFSQLCSIASLSRSLVSKGLSLLRKFDLIDDISTSKRKKTYTVDVGERLHDGWCKLPLAGIVDDRNLIVPFQSMHNRYKFELIGLMLYLYLLYARDNLQTYTLARKSTICSKLNCSLVDLNKAITYLIHIGLLDKIEKKMVSDAPSDAFLDSFYFYVKVSSAYALINPNTPPEFKDKKEKVVPAYDLVSIPTSLDDIDSVF